MEGQQAMIKIETGQEDHVASTTWPLRWISGLRSVCHVPATADENYCGVPAVAASGMAAAQPRRRKRAAPEMEKVPLKPPAESAAARTGLALEVNNISSMRLVGCH